MQSGWFICCKRCHTMTSQLDIILDFNVIFLHRLHWKPALFVPLLWQCFRLALQLHIRIHTHRQQTMAQFSLSKLMHLLQYFLNADELMRMHLLHRFYNNSLSCSLSPHSQFALMHGEISWNNSCWLEVFWTRFHRMKKKTGKTQTFPTANGTEF